MTITRIREADKKVDFKMHWWWWGKSLKNTLAIGNDPRIILLKLASYNESLFFSSGMLLFKREQHQPNSYKELWRLKNEHITHLTIHK